MKQIVWLACEYGRYGYRRITALLHWVGLRVNHKRVERTWREEGLKVTKKQPKRRRLWLNDLFVHRGVPEHIRSDSRESLRPRASESGW